MNKINISIGILSWRSPATLTNTLNSYKNSGLLDMVNDVTIFIQDADDINIQIANRFGVVSIPSDSNIGIGKAFTSLCEYAKTDVVLLLEDDWVNIENETVTYNRLSYGYSLLNLNIADAIKYRSRVYPGDPLYTRQFYGREMDSPQHLFECIHNRVNPDLDFPDIIKKERETGMYLCNSRYANHTNNPVMYMKDFYIENVSPFSGGGIELEEKIMDWWSQQQFTVAHGEGLFSHFRIDR
jgi:hypothetical protein